MTIKVDDDIPITPSRRGKHSLGVKSKYPFATMTAGQSFFVYATGDDYRRRVESAIRSGIQYHRACHGCKRQNFVIRKVKGGLRCWRLEDTLSREEKRAARAEPERQYDPSQPWDTDYPTG